MTSYWIWMVRYRERFIRDAAPTQAGSKSGWHAAKWRTHSLGSSAGKSITKLLSTALAILIPALLSVSRLIPDFWPYLVWLDHVRPKSPLDVAKPSGWRERHCHDNINDLVWMMQYNNSSLNMKNINIFSNTGMVIVTNPANPGPFDAITSQNEHSITPSLTVKQPLPSPTFR